MRTGWQTRSIGEAFRVVNGGTPKTGIASYWNGEHRWITPAEMGSLDSPNLSTSRRTLTEEGLRAAAELVPENSIILSSRAPIGHLVINQVPMAFNQGCKGLVPSKGVDTKFAYYFLLANVPLLESLGTGATFKELSSGKLKEVPFCFPSLAEQQRIVGILDEAFAGIAAAKAHVEQNRRNVRAVLDSCLQSVFAQQRDAWIEIRLGDMVTRLTNGYVGPTRNIYVQEGLPYLLARHVKSNRLSFDGKPLISSEFNQKNKKSILKEGDVLLVQSGHIGHSAVVPKDHEGHNCHAMIVITPVKEKLSGDFLSLYFNSVGMKQKFEQIRSGSTVPHLTCGAVRELSIPVPSLATQRHVVDRASDFAAEIGNLESLYTRKLAALDELKKSLLHQAFSGAL